MFFITLEMVTHAQNAGQSNEAWRRGQHGKLSQSFTSVTLLFQMVFRTLCSEPSRLFGSCLALARPSD